MSLKDIHGNSGDGARVPVANKFGRRAFVTLANGIYQSFYVAAPVIGPVFVVFPGGSGHRILVICLTLCW